MTPDQAERTRQELASFFGWPMDNIRKLNPHELAAWRKHLDALEALK